MTDLYDSFAKGVCLFDSNEASDMANYFAKLTIQKDPSHHALYYENMTWQLLSILTDTRHKTDVHLYASLKQWVSSIAVDQALLQKIEEYMDVEDEIMTLFQKNHFAHTEDIPRKRQKTDAITDKEYRKLYMKLRQNNLEPLPIHHQDVSRNYMLNGYLQYQSFLLENEPYQLNKRERLAWKKSVQHELETSVGKDKRLFYSVLAGETTTELYETACPTWEDVIWTYLNGQIETGLDQASEAKGNTVLTNTIAQLALSKDDILNRDDPRILFHLIQTTLLSENPQELIKKLYHTYFYQQMESTEPPLYQSEDRASWYPLLRFISTFILFGQQYLGWKESIYSMALLTDYAHFHANPSEPRPVIIATYASKLSPQYQIQMYSHFLQEFESEDDDEYVILLQLGREFHLDMEDILQYTHTHLFKKAIDMSSNRMIDVQRDQIQLETEGEVDKSSQILFKSIRWLTLDEHLCVEAFEAANWIIRYFLGICKIYLAQQVLTFFSDHLIEHMAVASQKTMRAFKVFQEFNSHHKLISLLIEFKAWKQLIENEPRDSGSVEDLILIHQWKDRVEKKTNELDGQFNQLIQGHWLGKDSKETTHVSKATLRQIYLPELVFQYRQLLVLSSSIIPKNHEKVKTLARLVTESSAFHDIQAAKKMIVLTEELAKSLPAC